ncbi:Uncharacterized SAM-binding protein YcdF, DUF218 family [Malonomonas rubra DSM 5091]|uniref:Uncharacterized SAM-binding protein YcdF, DUF218 family n=1 Tax=Malonomonas rubra DSM 5091 TaxID=1122189 RepID=A0A1M6IL14_MALRU|nr:ElyC/SanA/YdcF family protein [Malonomonas rubra]SHJ35171.1 Uncharacterized SAM-binding protein YcdF, DUF218 family [Malonomonas rubra DSM 5091]
MQNIDSYLFMLKKFLGSLMMPLPLVLLLLVWAVLMLLRKKTRWLGGIFTLLATALLFAASYAPIANRLIAPLEQEYPGYQVAAEPADYVAVLGHAHASSEIQPITSQLSPTGVVRVTEGIRIYRLNPGSKLIFSGDKFEEPFSYAEKSRQLAISLGVPAEDILLIEGVKDTAEETLALAAAYANSNLVLVTSASHMPRAMMLCSKVGLQPIPAPTNYLAKPVRKKLLFPSARTLAKTQYWAHEKLGQLWTRLTLHAGEKPTRAVSVQPASEDKAH